MDRDYDRASGIEYNWVLRENGLVEISGISPPSGDPFKITISIDGAMYSENGRETWRYSSTTDACQSSKGRIMRGLPCIPSVVKHFFLNNSFNPPHPMRDRVE